MRKLSFLSRWAVVLLTAVLLTPMVAFSQDVIGGDGSEEDPSNQIVTGNVGDVIPIPTNGMPIIDISSSNPDIVFIDFNQDRGAATAYCIAAGDVEVVITVSVGDVTRSEAYQCKVFPGTPDMYFYEQGEDGGQIRINEKFYNPDKDFIAPRLAVIIKEFNKDMLMFNEVDVAGVNIQYYSSMPNNFDVDETGMVTMIEPAERATITAEYMGNDNWMAAAASYELYVGDIEDPTKKEYADLYFMLNGQYVQFIEIKLGEEFVLPTIYNPLGLDVYVTCETDTVAKVINAQTGELEIIGSGIAYVQLNFDGNDKYYEVHNGYTLHVIGEENGKQKEPRIYFYPEYIEAEIGIDVDEPVIMNEYNVSPLIWSSSNQDVATVDENGQVTAVGIGEAQINVVFEGNDDFLPTEAQYTIRVSEHLMGLTVLGIEVTAQNCQDILGDGQKKAVYNEDANTLTLTDLYLDMADMKFDGRAIVEQTRLNPYIPFTVAINGKCEFLNTNICFAGQVFYFEGGELYMSGLMNQIQAAEVHLNDMSMTVVSAEGNNTPALMAYQKLELSGNSYLLAKTTADEDKDGMTAGLAITTNELVLNGNLAILTKGVTYVFNNRRGGFYTDAECTKYATEVEIGKVPVVVPEKEETTIDFSKQNPDGSEEVVFSQTVNDRYNEETGQLEISTSLTDEQVEEALEQLMPGSSMWTAALPGSIVFDIPAGEGEIQVQCMTLPGYTLKVKIEGKASVSITQTSFGWAKVVYNVEEPVHVVVYLHATNSESAPARIAMGESEDPTAGAFIKAIKITPKDAVPTDVEIVDANVEGINKVMKNGVLYIVRDGKMFNAQGVQVK